MLLKVLKIVHYKCIYATAPTVLSLVRIHSLSSLGKTEEASVTVTHAHTPFKPAQSQSGGRMCQQLEVEQGEGIRI